MCHCTGKVIEADGYVCGGGGGVREGDVWVGDAMKYRGERVECVCMGGATWDAWKRRLKWSGVGGVRQDDWEPWAC